MCAALPSALLLSFARIPAMLSKALHAGSLPGVYETLMVMRVS